MLGSLAGVVAGVATGVEAEDVEEGDVASGEGEAVGNTGVAVGAGVVGGIRVGICGDDPAGVVTGVPPHAARRTPRRRDAARRFAFICRRRRYWEVSRP